MRRLHRPLCATDSSTSAVASVSGPNPRIQPCANEVAASSCSKSPLGTATPPAAHARADDVPTSTATHNSVRTARRRHPRGSGRFFTRIFVLTRALGALRFLRALRGSIPCHLAHYCFLRRSSASLANLHQSPSHADQHGNGRPCKQKAHEVLPIAAKEAVPSRWRSASPGGPTATGPGRARRPVAWVGPWGRSSWSVERRMLSKNRSIRSGGSAGVIRLTTMNAPKPASIDQPNGSGSTCRPASAAPHPAVGDVVDDERKQHASPCAIAVGRFQRIPPRNMMPISAAMVSVNRNASSTLARPQSAKSTPSSVSAKPGEPADQQQLAVAGRGPEVREVEVPREQGARVDHEIRAGRHVGRQHAGDHQADQPGAEQVQAGIAEGVLRVAKACRPAGRPSRRRSGRSGPSRWCRTA